MAVEFRPSDIFIRRIMRYYYKADEKRVTSSAFKKKSKKPDDDCSVYLERIMVAPDEYLRTGLAGQLAVNLPVSAPLEHDIHLQHTPNDLEPSHCSMRIETDDQCSLLADASSLRPKLTEKS